MSLAIVNHIEKYIPELLGKLMPVHSPMMCTAIYLKKYTKISDKHSHSSVHVSQKEKIEIEIPMFPGVKLRM